MTDTDCTETYRECVRSRQERVRRAAEEHPDLSARRLAEIAEVDERTVRNYRTKMEDVSSTARSVELRDLYDATVNYERHRNVQKIVSGLWNCSWAEMAYVFDKILPAYRRELGNAQKTGSKRRAHNGDLKMAELDNAEEDQPADDAG